jgi:predicted transcriptional regulator
MSQSNILKLIEMSKKPINVLEIMKKTGLAQSSVGHALLKLTNQGEVKRMDIKVGNTLRYVYWAKNSPKGVISQTKRFVWR